MLRKISFFLYPQVQLKDIFEYLPGKMNTELAESGLNLSVGQKQLVCLARTILKKSQILIIDKATSNVDPRYGAEIQETLNLSSWILKVVNWKHILLASWIFLDNINSRKQRKNQDILYRVNVVMRHPERARFLNPAHYNLKQFWGKTIFHFWKTINFWIDFLYLVF